MVEGPGCKLKGLKIKSRLKNQMVKNVSGNAVDKYKKKADMSSPFNQLIGRKLDDVQTLGKELFMYFGDLCLRVHFLMAGQSFINNEKVDNDLGENAETASLELEMSKDVLTFKKSSVDVRPAQPCKDKYLDLNDIDICSPVFNFSRAVSLVKEQQDRQICDVLLDQSILPGVGNIIKNEALFDSGIRPSSKVSELQEEHISHLVKMTRDFTNIFYQCRRDGKPLYPHQKIYSKRKCGQCESKVTICRLGDDNERVTYFCEVCQTNDLKNRKLPVKNSLLGWIKTGISENQREIDWTCGVCTLINKESSSTCNACLTPKPKSVGVNDCSADTSLKSAVSLNNSISLNTCRKRPLTENFISGPSTKNRKIMGQVKSSSLTTDTANRQSRSSQSSSQSKFTGSQSQVSNSQSQSVTQNSNKIPVCKTHKRRCTMREVRKKGENLGRWFFSCSAKSCNFFEWADEKFPLCPDHGKPCTIRTVMKIGPNNGRKFFACKMPKNKQCKFFEWAEGYD